MSSNCPGCGWTGYKHEHDDSEDGPRAECCLHTCKADTNTRRRGGASTRSHGRAVVASPSEGEGSRGGVPARLGPVPAIVTPWSGLLGIDWMSKVAREGIGGVRLA